MNRPIYPGPARITLVLLAVVPAAMAYPWPATRDRWVLGIAAVLAVVLLAWWRGMHLTTIVRRRLAMLRRDRGEVPERGPDVRTTAVLRIEPGADGPEVLPLPLIASYLDRYGLRADAIRITSRDSGPADRATWIALTMSAADNLAALQARSARIPLHETAEVAVRRLADQLREDGWEVVGANDDDVPELPPPGGREAWRAVRDGQAGYVAAYRVNVDSALPEALAAIWSQPARETWSAVEFASGAAGLTLAAACAFRTEHVPGGAATLPGLIPQHGNHRAALQALDPLSVRRLDGHTGMPDGVLSQLRWPAALAAPGLSGARHAAPPVSRRADAKAPI